MQADFPDKVRLIQRQCGDPTKLRLLDVGCGKGYFVAEAAKAGFQSAGIDISSSGVAFARNQLNVVAHCADICDNTLPAGGFDVATCWATIEHLPYPLDTLKAIFRVLRPGGWLFLDTGLADSDLFERKLIGTSQWFDPDER
jgi:2-polyprenyl-3-methyl-5-hydroxy-6-metoxy-1,4-benzoquinol methylase